MYSLSSLATSGKCTLRRTRSGAFAPIPRKQPSPFETPGPAGQAVHPPAVHPPLLVVIRRLSRGAVLPCTGDSLAHPIVGSLRYVSASGDLSCVESAIPAQPRLKSVPTCRVAVFGEARRMNVWRVEWEATDRWFHFDAASVSRDAPPAAVLYHASSTVWPFRHLRVQRACGSSGRMRMRELCNPHIRVFH
ncbi:hypothetical protein OH77DRAFT_283604 [Trametes cingulata]|nr:hypothetical protein OH77DRAFT_283604 [Trametes cingulata]